MQLKRFLPPLILGAVLYSSAQAATLTYSDFYPNPSNPNNPGGLEQTAWPSNPAYPANLTVPQFDPNLGTLDSVIIQFEGEYYSEGTLINRDAATKDLTLTIEVDLSLYMPAGLSLNDIFASVTKSETYPNAVPGDIKSVQIPGQNPGPVPENPISYTLTSPSDLNLFTGNGDVVFSAAADSRSSTSGAANIDSSIRTYAGATVTVVYNYTPPLQTSLYCDRPAPSIGSNGTTVTATLEGDESCNDLNITQTITCSGNLNYAPVASIPGCSVTENPNGTFNITCPAGINQNSQTMVSVINAISGDDGTCTTQVTGMSCTTPSGQNLSANINNCQASYTQTPQPPQPPVNPGPPPAYPPTATGIPTLSQWGLILLTSLIGLVGVAQRRKD